MGGTWVALIPSFQMSNLYFRRIQGNTILKYSWCLQISKLQTVHQLLKFGKDFCPVPSAFYQASNQSYRNSSFRLYMDLKRICWYIRSFIMRQKAVSLNLICGIVHMQHSFEITFSMCNS